MDKTTQSDVGHSMKITELYLREAVKNIDCQFGDGYAKKHPELVSSYIQSCSIVRHSMRSKDPDYQAEVVRLVPSR